MIIKTKALEIDKFHFWMYLNIFIPNVLFTFKIMNLTCVFNKSYSFLCYLKNINDINQDVIRNNYIQNTIVN
jgi:hypothetical protein